MSVSLPSASTGLVAALSALSGLTALLRCTDPDKWASLGRPDAQGIGHLINLAQAEVTAELRDVVDLPD